MCVSAHGEVTAVISQRPGPKDHLSSRGTVVCIHEVTLWCIVGSERRYPRRNVPERNYTEGELLQDDEYLCKLYYVSVTSCWFYECQPLKHGFSQISMQHMSLVAKGYK